MKFKLNERKILKEDKIINNSYNQGEYNIDDLLILKVSDEVYPLYEDQISENIIERHTLKMLDEDMYEIFKNSPFFEKYKKPRRTDGSDRVKVYYYFKEELIKRRKYTNIEIFIAIAEFFQINYEQLYNEIGVLEKENILKELNEKYNLFNKIKTKRLF